MRSKKTKEDFIKYMAEHEEQRFWQSVRNFAGVGFVLVADTQGDEIDTFYIEELEDD